MPDNNLHMATENDSDLKTTALLRNLITALEDKKAEKLKVLYVGGISNITDYLVLATGNSETHLRALRIEAERIFDAVRAPLAGTDQGGFGSGWTVLDAYQIMVHFFTAEQRENYALDKLWKDASEVDAKTLAVKQAAAPKKPKAVSKVAQGKAGAKPKGKPSKPATSVKKPVRAAKKSSSPTPKKSAVKKPSVAVKRKPL